LEVTVKITGPVEMINGIGPSRFILNRPLGAEVVTDGEFDTACGVNWTCNAPWTIGSGVASIDGSQGGTTSLTQAGILTSGAAYYVQNQVLNRTAGILTMALGAAGAGTSRDADGTYAERIVSKGANLLINANASYIGEADKVSIREIF
jgi:hypothetical protein